MLEVHCNQARAPRGARPRLERVDLDVRVHVLLFVEARPSGELDMELELEHKLELVMVEKFCNVKSPWRTRGSSSVGSRLLAASSWNPWLPYGRPRRI